MPAPPPAPRKRTGPDGASRPRRARRAVAAASVLLLLALAGAPVASAAPLCHALVEGVAAACAYDHASGSDRCDESPSAGSRHTVAYFELDGRATVLLAAGHACERDDVHKQRADSADTAYVVAGTYGDLPQSHQHVVWTADDTGCRIGAGHWDGAQREAHVGSTCPLGPPDAGWGRLLP